MSELKLSEIARLIGGRLIGDPEVRIKGISSLEEAGPYDLTFVVSDKYLEGLSKTKAAAAIVHREVPFPLPQIVVQDPYVALARAMGLFYRAKHPGPGVSELAWVSPKAKIGQGVWIGPFVYVGEDASIGDRVVVYPGVYVGAGVKIGDDSVIYPNVVIYEGTVIGKKVIIHAGTVIGADGFGYVRDGDQILKIPQVGKVEIEDEVEIGANCCIDRATFGKTLIGRGTKIDNLVQIGHNVHIGPNCIIVAQVGVGGSSTLGKGVTVAGQVGIADHVKIGDGARISGKAGIFRDVGEKETVGGIPQMPHKRWMRVVAELLRLPEWRKECEEVKRRLERLESFLSRGETR